MKVIKPSFETMERPSSVDALKKIEWIGRTCYKSEDKITENSCVDFVKMLVRRGHTAMLEHVSVTVRFIADRGFSHELVRHRLASYAQESTRYCDYEGELHVVCPLPHERGHEYIDWYSAMRAAELAYKSLRSMGVKPQIARSVLPICVKTEIIITADLTEWLHIFRLRDNKAAHPMMRNLMSRVHWEFSQWLPEVFPDEED